MKHGISAFIGILVLACGPDLSPSGIMTPEQRLQEEERLAYESEQRRKQNDTRYEGPIQEDERAAFDQKHAEMELKRASISARTCLQVVDGAKNQGIADINITFVNDGSVGTATVSSPYEGTPLAECILNAYKPVKVPTFRESEFTMNWQLDFNPPKPKPEEEEEEPPSKKGGKKEADKKDADKKEADKKDAEKTDKKSGKK